PIMRALYSAMEGWLRDELAPPPSAYPTLADGGLLTLEQFSAAFPTIPGVRLPAEMGEARLLDLGPRWPQGIVDREPPGFGASYGVRLPAVNEDGNEPAGIQPLELRVPLATYTGWNLRHPDNGNPEALVSMLGSYFPLPATRADADARGDPRQPIAARYRDREEFLGRIDAAIAALVAERLLLEEDAATLRRRAEAQWAAHAPVADTAAAGE